MNLRPQKRYEPKGPKAFMNTRHKNMNLRAQDVFMFVCEPTKKCEHKAPKILQTEGDHEACSANASGGEALRPPLQPPSSCLAYLLCRDSAPPPETSPPPIKTKEKNNSQKFSAPQNYIMLYHTVSCYFTSSESMF